MNSSRLVPELPSWAESAARIETDRAGVIVGWNRAAEALYGYSLQEVLGRPVISVVVPRRAKRQAAAIMEALALGRSWEGEFDVRHRDGHLLCVRVHDAPLLDADGEVIGVVGYSVNASDSPHRRPVTLTGAAPDGWTHALRAGMFDPSARMGLRMRLLLILSGVAMECGWDVVIWRAGWERSVGIAGTVAIVAVLAIAVADVVAGIVVALISGALFTITIAEAPPRHSFAYAAAVIALWVVTALGAGVGAVRLRGQAQRGAAESVSLHRELVGLLLPSPRLHRVDVSVAAVCRPGEQRLELGGDFYAATERADGSIALLVGDVSGHGPAAAALGAMLRAAWEGLVEADVPAHARLRTLNYLLMEHASHEEFFATLCSVVINQGLTEATVTLAGHPSPILIHRGALINLDLPIGVPLGVSDVAVWTPQRVSLPKPFSLLLYTDGVIEGRATPDAADRFGEKRLIETLLRSPADGRELLDEILLAAESAHGGNLPDDAALLLLETKRRQPQGAPTRQSSAAI
jgi:PAS domain S-box-containing protein